MTNLSPMCYRFIMTVLDLVCVFCVDKALWM